MSQNHATSNLSLLAPRVAGDASVLTPEALRFLAGLGRKFADRVPALLERRRGVQARLDAGERFDFLRETRDVREADWTVAPLPEDLLDRRVEITGPVDPKMIINALNSGASVFMAVKRTASVAFSDRINVCHGVSSPVEKPCSSLKTQLIWT